MPLITITYSVGSDGDFIGRKVAERLKIEFYDNERLQAMALNLGVSVSDLTQFDEKTPGLLSRLLGNKPQAYLNIMEKVIHQVAEKGQGVIIGHGSPFLLQDFGCAFHVKIQSQTLSRVKRIMERQGLSTYAAQTVVKNMDDQQKSFLQYAFKFDVDDPNGYDLVINREKISAGSAVQIIADSTQLDDLSECSLGAFLTMQRLGIEKKVRAELAENHIDLSTLQIKAGDDGIVHITGLASSEADREKLTVVMKKMPGVIEFRVNVSVWSQTVAG